MIPTKRHWMGTGFMFGKFIENNPVNEKHSYHLWLITNKHVLMNCKDIYIKFNSTQDPNSKDYKIPLFFRNGRPLWAGHPSDNIDVAAIWLNPDFLKSEGSRFEYFQSDCHVFIKEKMLSSGVTEGDRIFVLGFPMGLVEKDRQYVICRGGNIARIHDFLENRTTEFLIDSPVFPGNSGGPVILCPSAISIQGTKSIKQAALIGIVKSYLPYNEMGISAQTKEPRIMFMENSGLAVVESVDSIIETVDLGLKRIKSRISQAKKRSSKAL